MIFFPQQFIIVIKVMHRTSIRLLNVSVHIISLSTWHISIHVVYPKDNKNLYDKSLLFQKFKKNISKLILPNTV